MRWLLPTNNLPIHSTTTAELWRDADAVVEDVMGGICISLLLPCIERVAVKLVSSRVVAVEATRLVLPDEGDHPTLCHHMYICTPLFRQR